MRAQLTHWLPLFARHRHPAAAAVVWPQTVFTDGLEGAFGWAAAGGQAGFTLEANATALRTATKGLYLKTRTVGAANGDYLIAKQVTDAPTQAYWTLTAYLYLPSKTPSDVVELGLHHYADGNRYAAAFLHKTGSNKFQYYNSAGGYTDVPGGAYVWPEATWVPLTLQIHPADHKYGTVTWPGGSVDLSAQSIRNVGADAATGCRLNLEIDANASAPTLLYADDFVLQHSPNP